MAEKLEIKCAKVLYKTRGIIGLAIASLYLDSDSMDKVSKYWESMIVSYAISNGKIPDDVTDAAMFVSKLNI